MSPKGIQSFLKILTGSALLVGLSSPLLAQEEEWEKMLREEVKVANPIFKPVIGFGIGYMNFYGDVKNNIRTPLTGNMGFKINVSTFLDNKHYYTTNFNMLFGTLTGNQQSLTNAARNLNFQSSIVAFGLNIEYRFGHFYHKTPFLSPFLSVGVEDFSFNTKGDLYDASGMSYYYWDDGTIRSKAEGVYPNKILHRDFSYESDLRKLDLYGKGNYTENAFAFPIDAGLDFHVSRRVTVRLGHSMHFTTTDNLDNLAGTDNTTAMGNAGGNSKKDNFSFSYITFHLDLFSSPQTKTVEKMYANLDDFDYAFYDDEDKDGVFDGWDKCPGTPAGVAVDSLGCPFDRDKDGVPDYRDKEPDSPIDVAVDHDGKAITDSVINSFLAQEAIPHKEAYLYWKAAAETHHGKVEIPEKFKFIDTDHDGYLSFEEVLQAIDAFFDYKNNLTQQDLYELEDFFFAQ